MNITEHLTTTELATLGAYETSIEQGLASFVEVGNALAKIRDGRLYRAEFATFAEYCSGRWKLSKSHVNRLVTAAEVVADVTPIGVIPTSEAQARPLAKLPKEQRAEVWQVTVDAAPKAADGTPKVTAKQVAAAAKRITEASGEDVRDEEPAATRGNQERAAPVQDEPDADHIFATPIALIERTDKTLAEIVYAWPQVMPNGRAAIMSIVRNYQ